jgi:hypothetical protein
MPLVFFALIALKQQTMKGTILSFQFLMEMGVVVIVETQKLGKLR